MKKCTKCKTLCSLDSFCKDKQKPDGLHSHCKGCRCKVAKLKREIHRDSINASQRAYRQRNLEEIRRKDRERNKCPKRKAYKNARQRYYLVKHRSLNKAFMEEVELIYRVASYLSSYDEKQYEVDHIIPLQGKEVSGLHVPWNLQIIDRFENRSKQTKY